MKPVELQVAFRALTVREAQNQAERKLPTINLERWPRTVLVFDTETTIDAAQSLMFGSARVYRWTAKGTLECRQEYLFYADDLAQSNSDGFVVLKYYVRAHKGERI